MLVPCNKLDLLNKEKCLSNFEIDSNTVDFKLLLENTCSNVLINVNNKNVLINWFIYLSHIYYTKLNSKDLNYLGVHHYIAGICNICAVKGYDIFEKIMKVDTKNYIIIQNSKHCSVYTKNCQKKNIIYDVDLTEFIIYDLDIIFVLKKFASRTLIINLKNMETIHTIDLIIDFVLKISDHVYFCFPSNDIIEYYDTNSYLYILFTF